MQRVLSGVESQAAGPIDPRQGRQEPDKPVPIQNCRRSPSCWRLRSRWVAPLNAIGKGIKRIVRTSTGPEPTRKYEELHFGVPE